MKKILSILLIIVPFSHAETISRDEAIQRILNKETSLDLNEKHTIGEALLHHKIEKDTLTEKLLDENITPIRDLISIYTSPTSEPSVVYLTPTKPTTITFVTKDMQPVSISNIMSVDDTDSPRFKNEKVEKTNNIYEFSTTVYKGWTTMDILFEGYPYPIPIKLVAGKEYHMSPIANLIDDEGVIRKTKGGMTKALETIESKIDNILIDFANNKSIDENAYEMQVIDYEVTRGLQPKVIAYEYEIDGINYYFVRTNGLLAAPDFEKSQPAATVTEPKTAYMIRADRVMSFIEIYYQQKSFIYTLESKGVDF